MNCLVRMPIEEVLPIPMCRARLRVVVLSAILTPVEDRSLDPLRENSEFGARFYSRQQEVDEYDVQEQLSSQFARTQISPNQGGGAASTLIKAELPCSTARRGKNYVLKTVKVKKHMLDCSSILSGSLSIFCSSLHC